MHAQIENESGLEYTAERGNSPTFPIWVGLFLLCIHFYGIFSSPSEGSLPLARSRGQGGFRASILQRERERGGTPNESGGGKGKKKETENKAGG